MMHCARTNKILANRMEWIMTCRALQASTSRENGESFLDRRMTPQVARTRLLSHLPQKRSRGTSQRQLEPGFNPPVYTGWLSATRRSPAELGVVSALTSVLLLIAHLVCRKTVSQQPLIDLQRSMSQAK